MSPGRGSLFVATVLHTHGGGARLAIAAAGSERSAFEANALLRYCTAVRTPTTEPPELPSVPMSSMVERTPETGERRSVWNRRCAARLPAGVDGREVLRGGGRKPSMLPGAAGGVLWGPGGRCGSECARGSDRCSSSGCCCLGMPAASGPRALAASAATAASFSEVRARHCVCGVPQPLRFPANGELGGATSPPPLMGRGGCAAEDEVAVGERGRSRSCGVDAAKSEPPPVVSCPSRPLPRPLCSPFFSSPPVPRPLQCTGTGGRPHRSSLRATAIRAASVFGARLKRAPALSPGRATISR